MWSVFIAREASDELTAELWELGTAGIVEENRGVRAFFEDGDERSAICMKLGAAESAMREEAGFVGSKQLDGDYDPLLIGQRFYIAPAPVTMPGRLRLTIDSSNAFGSGRHESTQLCIEALEKHLKPGQWVADIGCGSGILGAAAKMLGAGMVVSCDINEDVVRAGWALIERPFFVGSADGMRRGSADLVLANLSVKVLDIVAGDLRRIAKADGLIVIGGFLNEKPPRLFEAWEVSSKGDWGCWVCRPDGVRQNEAQGEPEAHNQQWWL